MSTISSVSLSPAATKVTENYADSSGRFSQLKQTGNCEFKPTGGGSEYPLPENHARAPAHSNR